LIASSQGQSKGSYGPINSCQAEDKLRAQYRGNLTRGSFSQHHRSCWRSTIRGPSEPWTPASTRRGPCLMRCAPQWRGNSTGMIFRQSHWASC